MYFSLFDCEWKAYKKLWQFNLYIKNSNCFALIQVCPLDLLSNIGLFFPIPSGHILKQLGTIL